MGMELQAANRVCWPIEGLPVGVWLRSKNKAKVTIRMSFVSLWGKHCVGDAMDALCHWLYSFSQSAEKRESIRSLSPFPEKNKTKQ